VTEDLLECALREGLHDLAHGLEAAPDLGSRVLGHRHRLHWHRPTLAILGVAAVGVMLIAGVLLASSSKQRTLHPADTPLTGVDWQSVSFVDAHRGFAVGTRPHCNAQGSCTKPDFIVRSTVDSGRTWVVVYDSSGSGAPFAFTSFGSPGRLYAASATLLYYVPPGPVRAVYSSTDGGRTWTVVQVSGPFIYAPPVLVGSDLLIDVPGKTGPDGNTVTCGPGVQLVHGTTVQTVTQPSSPVGNDGGIASGVDGTIWRSAIGTICSTAGNTSGHIHIYRSDDHARSWKALPDPLGNDRVSGTIGYDKMHLWAMDVRSAGYDQPDTGTLHLVRSADGGQTWTALAKTGYDSRSFVGDGVDLARTQLIALSPKNLVFAAGAQIYASRDGGNTFTLVTRGSLRTTSTQSLTRLGTRQVVALGTDGTLRASTDGGRTWTVRAHL
jgi:photosystem II stability/assembly factor-like uncharacterized protein